MSALAQSKQLTNADVIEMIQGGLSEATIILSIEKSTKNFDTSPKGLIALKKAGATQKILDAVMGEGSQVAEKPKAVQAASPAPTSVQQDVSPNNVTLINNGKQYQMRQLVQNAFKGKLNPLTSVPGVGLFAKNKSYSRFKGSRSELRLPNSSLQWKVMLPYYEDAKANFSIVKLTSKEDFRQIKIGSSSVGGGLSIGHDKDDIFEITIQETVKNKDFSTYLVKPLAPLPNGEYAFVYGGAYFDFAIDSSIASGNTSLPAPISTENTEVMINAPAEKVRTVLLLNFTRQKFNLDKDTASQLVFSKEAGGLSGNLAGIFMGKGGRNPRMILTFLIMPAGSGSLVTGKYAYVYPDGQGMGNVKESDSSKARKQIAAELMKVKAEAER